MKKIENPVVLINKRENSDSYAVAITSGSQDYHDAVLMATMEPDMTGDDIDTWSKTGYYMAEEIQRLRQQLIAPLSIGELLQRLEAQTYGKWVQVDCESSCSRNGKSERHIQKSLVGRADSIGIESTHQITSSMSKDIALRLGAELNDEEAEIFADGYNAANAKCLTITLPPMPILGSTSEWYQGFAAGAASMRDECASRIIAAGIKAEIK